MRDVVASPVYFGKLKSLKPIEVAQLITPVRETHRNSSMYEQRENDGPFFLLYRPEAQGGPVTYNSDKVNHRTYRERLRIIDDCKKQGFTVGTMVVPADEHPVEDWTKTPLMWIDQYLLGTVDSEIGWQPLLVAYCDDKDIEYIQCGPEDLVILDANDFESRKH